jgi:hypothetical protein
MEEQSPGRRRPSRGRGGRAGSSDAARTPIEPTAGDRPTDNAAGRPATEAADRPAGTDSVKPPPPVLFQPPSPSPSGEPAPLRGEGATAEARTTAPVKKATVKKATVKKAPARKAAAKKAPAKKTATTKVEPEQVPASAATKPAPAKAAPPSRKKAAPRKTAVPKQPGPEPGHAEPAHPAKTEPPQPTTTVPADSTKTEPASPAAELPEPVRQTPPVGAVPRRRSIDDPWRIAVRLLDDPGHAPELLAAVAVRLIGPRAAAWADAVRSAYPAATNEGLARLATRRFVRLAGAGGLVAAGAGLFAPAAELAIAALTRAGLVLHLAAAHGHDPSDPARAAELLVLTQVHADEGAARAAVKAAAEAYERGAAHAPGPADADAPPLTRAAEAALRLAVPLAAETGGWGVLRLVARFVPGARVVAATGAQISAAERLAIRASAYYRRRRPG